MVQTTPLLFAYGTLLSGDTGPTGRAQRDRLLREARVLGPATVPGRLYHLGRYPGFVPSDDPRDLVHGELLELAVPDRTLAWLDAYEGIVPGIHAHNEYERRILKVVHGRAEVEAWSYVLIQPTAGKPLIASGSWIEPR